MTDEQFEKQSRRVRKYSSLKSDKDRLERERSIINLGIVSLENLYGRKIDCCGRYDGFYDGLKDALNIFYNFELNRIQKLMDDI